MNATGTKQLFLWIRRVFNESLILYGGWLMLGHPIETGSHWATWPLKTSDVKVMA